MAGSQGSPRISATLLKRRLTQTELINKLEGLTAKITELEEKTAQLYENNASFQQKNEKQSHEISELSSKFSDLQQNHLKVEENCTKLQKDNTQFQNDFARLRKDNTLVQTNSKKEMQSLNVYLDEFHADHNKLLEEQRKLNTKINDLRSDQQTEINIRKKQQTEINNIKTIQKAHLSERKTEDFVQKSDLVEEMTTLREEMTSQLASVKDAVQKHHNELQTLLQSDFNQFKEDSDKLQAEMTQVQEYCRTLAGNESNMRTEINEFQKCQEDLTKGIEMITKEQKTVLDEMSKQQKKHVKTVQANLQQKQDMLTSDVHAVKTEVKQMKISIKGSLGQASLDIEALETRLGKARQLFDVGKLSRDRTKRSGTMIFDTVLINAGGHYSDETCVFTAPCTGLYFFTASVGINIRNGSVHDYIMVDDVSCCAVQGANGAGSGHTVVPLTEGQRVWVKANKPGDKYNPASCWFRGTLVLPY